MSKFDRFKNEFFREWGTMSDSGKEGTAVLLIIGVLVLLVLVIMAVFLLKTLLPYIAGAVVLYGAYWLYQKTKK